MRATAVAMLDATHPRGNPGESINLYVGPIEVDGRSAAGRVEFRLRPRPDVVWSVEQDWHDISVDEVALVIPHDLGRIETTAGRRYPNEGCRRRRVDGDSVSAQRAHPGP